MSRSMTNFLHLKEINFSGINCNSRILLIAVATNIALRLYNGWSSQLPDGVILDNILSHTLKELELLDLDLQLRDETGQLISNALAKLIAARYNYLINSEVKDIEMAEAAGPADDESRSQSPSYEICKRARKLVIRG